MFKFTRYVDRFQPGDTVPEDVYDKEQIEQMVKNGLVSEVETPAPETKPATRKTAGK